MVNISQILGQNLSNCNGKNRVVLIMAWYFHTASGSSVIASANNNSDIRAGVDLFLQRVFGGEDTVSNDGRGSLLRFVLLSKAVGAIGKTAPLHAHVVDHMANPVARVDSVGDSAHNEAPTSTVATDDDEVATEIRAEGVAWRGRGAATAAIDRTDEESRLTEGCSEREGPLDGPATGALGDDEAGR